MPLCCCAVAPVPVCRGRVLFRCSSALQARPGSHVTTFFPRLTRAGSHLEKELLVSSVSPDVRPGPVFNRGAVSPRARSGWHHPPAAPLLLLLPSCIGAQQMQELQFSKGWVLEALAPPPGSLLRLWCLSLTSGHQCSGWSRRDGHPTHAWENPGRTVLGHWILHLSLTLLGLKLSAWMVQGLF